MQVTPEDPPVRLVLLPGVDGTELMFAPLLLALPKWIAAEVVTYPERGRNRYEDLLPLVQDAIARGGECVVLGWSFSGPLALRAAARDARVRGVILAGSFVTPPLRGARWLRWSACTPVVAAGRLLWRLPHLLQPGTPLRRALAKVLGRVPSATIAARLRAILCVDAREDLRCWSGRVLYLAGRSDHVVPHRVVAEIQRLRPDTELVGIDGRHFALFTAAWKAAAFIAVFAYECAARKS